MSEPDRANLVRVLADFAVWLEHGHARAVDLGYYLQLAGHYLEVLRSHPLVDVPYTGLARCDLCGQQFYLLPDTQPEALTGNNFRWCPTCHEQQGLVYQLIGSAQYRKAWRDHEEGN